MNQTPNTRAASFARLGKWADIAAKIKDAKRYGGVEVKVDHYCGTVVATMFENGSTATLFRALRKSTDAWIVIYNANFYEK